MFGNVSVPSEILFEHTVRCVTPPSPHKGPVQISLFPPSLLTSGRVDMAGLVGARSTVDMGGVGGVEKQETVDGDQNDISSNATFYYYGK